MKLEEFLKSDKKAKEFINEQIKLQENGGKYGCVMLNLDQQKDNRLLKLRMSIDPIYVYSHSSIDEWEAILHDENHNELEKATLYTNSEDEDLGYEEKPHCTVFYGLENDADLFKIKKYCQENYPNSFTLKTSHLHIFENVEKGECDCLVLKCVPPKELVEINAWIKNNFPNKQTYSEYIPHITLAYIKKGTCKEFLNKPIEIEFEVSVNDFIYSGHDKVLMENINESFVDYIKPYKDQDGFMVFKNPTNSELRELESFKSGELRAIILFNDPKNIYVSDFSLLHPYIAAKVGLGKAYIQLNILYEMKAIAGVEFDKVKMLKSNPWVASNLKGFRIIDNYGENLEEVI